MTALSPLIDLASGNPPPCFVIENFGANLELCGPNLISAFPYTDLMGLPPLRDAYVARWAVPSNGRDGVLVSHGALSGIDLVVRTYRHRLNVVYVADPGYREAIRIFLAHGLTVRAIPRRPDGELNADALLKGLRSGRAAIYLVPHVNNPDGRSMHEPEMAAVASILASTGAMCIEDEAYRDLTFHEPPVPSLLARTFATGASNVIRLVSLSKCLMPGLRICFVEARPAVIAELAANKLDFGTSPVASMLALSMIASPKFDICVTHLRMHMKRRCELAVSILTQHGLEVSPPDGGYFVIVKYPHCIDSEELLLEARREGVDFSPGSPFCVESSANFLRLSVGQVPEASLHVGLSRLINVMKRRFHIGVES